MSENIKTYYILLSSPSDVKKERKIVSDIIEEINSSIKDNFNACLKVIKWETNGHSSIGKSAQDILNLQLGSYYDIYIGLMWTRIGTPTKRSKSGTVEEFNIAYKKYKKNKKKLEIMFYFSDIKIAPSRIEISQHQEVQCFKKHIRKIGIYSPDYSSYSAFKKQVKDDLYHHFFKLEGKNLNPKIKIVK